MKDKFAAFYHNTDFTNLWRDATFIFDTNALLSCYRFPKQTAEHFLEMLSQVENRLWIPHQIGLEFHLNRVSVIEGQVKKYNERDEELNTQVNAVLPLVSEKLRTAE